MSVIVEIDWCFGIDFLEPAAKMRAIEESIGRINPLFSLFQQLQKAINDVVQLQNLTNFPRHVPYCSVQAVDPSTISHPPCRPPAATFARSNLVSRLVQTDLAG
jgi:hypothetical protein